MSQELRREDRYIVIKRKDLDTVFRSDVREQFYTALHRLNCHDVLIPQRKFLVIESDWPEYEIVWQMIEARMTGRNSQSQQYVLRAMALNYRDGHSWDHLDGEAVTKAADEITRLQAENAALQQRLNVADQRVDDLQSEMTKARESNAEMASMLLDWQTWLGAKRESCDEGGKLLWDRINAVTAHQSAPAACWTLANYECPGDGVGACKKCPSAPAAKGGSDE
jgi:hypothetical protein